MKSRVEALVSRALGRSPLLAIAVGAIATVMVQSSSITTSLMVPLAGAGVLTLAQAFPVTLGANIGTTITALLASLAAESPDALVIALAHVTFNVLGILIIYPFPRIRAIPLRMAEWTGVVATRRKSLVAAYVIGLFVVFPLAILLIA